MVVAGHAAEFDRLFWKWIRDVLNGTGPVSQVHVDAIVVDLGMGQSLNYCLLFGFLTRCQSVV
jgi:hypothetical protein